MRLVMAGVLIAGLSVSSGRAESPPALDFTAISRVENTSNDCAVTFDDGPGRHTDLLLNALAQKGIKATFFVLGEHVRQYPEMIRRMVAEGHEVENHSWDHPDMRKLDPAQRQKEMQDTIDLLKTLGVTPHFFRPPYGAYDPALVEQARQDNMVVVLWSHDSADWRYHSVAQLEGNVLSVDKGAHGIFLFHDIHNSTIAAIPAVLDELKEKGCRFVTVTEWAEDTIRVNTAPVVPAAEALPQGEFRGWLKSWLKN